MGITRRFKKGSDSLLQNNDKQWELINEGTSSVRSDYDFTQMVIPQTPAEDLQQSEMLVDDPEPTANNNSPQPEAIPQKPKRPWIKHFDAYIIKKFLGTFIFAILLLLAIVVMFDINEKLDAMLTAPLKETVFKYFLNFLPYFANQFAPLFVFITVIFFTSKLADHSEIIAMMSSGISFKRLMVPYLVSATIIAIGTLQPSGHGSYWVFLSVALLQRLDEGLEFQSIGSSPVL